MGQRADTKAAYYRKHKAAFERALREGITPAAAKELIEHEERLAQCHEESERLEAKYGPATAPYKRWNAPHMMRD